MYNPPFNTVEDEAEIRAMVAAARTAWLVTTGADGLPAASLLPILWRGDTVVAHLAKANPQWRDLPADAPVLLIVTGPDAYVSPSWYAAKVEHGKVVPTWNYSAVQLSGTVRVHHEPEWLRQAVVDLTRTHEDARAQPWHVDDAPTAYVEGQLRGIVGVEITVTRVEGKAKLSQNRSMADREGVVTGLRGEDDPGATQVAEQMAARLTD